MRLALTTALACMLSAGCGGVRVRNDIGVVVPRASLAALIGEAASAAVAGGSRVEKIEFDTIRHPDDTAVAVVRFRPRPLGEGVRELARQCFSNGAWPSRFDTGTLVAEYPRGLPPASAAWKPCGGVYRERKLRVEVGGGQVFITLGEGLDARAAAACVERFAAWAGADPPPVPYPPRASEMTGINRDAGKQEVTVRFDGKLSGQLYVFDVSGGGWRFKHVRMWMS